MSEAVAVSAVAEAAAPAVASEAAEPAEKKDQPVDQDQLAAASDQPEVSADLESQDVDAELEEMKKRLAQMEAESAGANQGNTPSNADAPPGPGYAVSQTAGTQSAAAGASAANPQMPPSQDTISDIDARSVYVGNVDYAATGDQLSEHFADCGTINRVTIMCNKATGMPKGFAYIEFEDINAAQNALILNESQFLGRPLKVVAKRTNIPMAYRGGYRGGRGRFNRGGRGYPRRGRRSWRGRWTPY